MENFQIGALVVLKSGGPTMTVKGVGDYGPLSPNPGVLCIWFDSKHGNHTEKVFHPETIEAA